MTSYIALPTIELVRRTFCATNPVGDLIETSVRKLAALLGRSAGQMSKILKQLEADGWIACLADGRGTLVEVLRSDLTMPIDQPRDRHAPHAPIDQSIDRFFAPVAAVAATPNAAPSAEPPHESDQSIDRVAAESATDHTSDRSVAMEDHDSCMQQQQHARVRENGGIAHQDQQKSVIPPPIVPRKWRDIQIGTPGYTEADFKRDLAKGASRPDIKNWVGLVVEARSRGEDVYSANELAQRAAAYAGAPAAQEQQHGPSQSASRPARAAQRPAPHADQRHDQRPGARGRAASSNRADAATYAAILASAKPLHLDLGELQL